MKMLMTAFTALVMITSAYAGMGELDLALREAVATEFQTTNSTSAYYALMDNMVITDQGENGIPGCDVVYPGKTTTITGEMIYFDACVNIHSRYQFDIAVSERQAD